MPILSDFTQLPLFEGCIMAKIVRIYFHPFQMRPHFMPFLIWCILTCVAPCKLFTWGAKYFISFIDDYSRYTYVHHLKHKSEAFAMFQVYNALVKKQNDKVIKVLHTNIGGEYSSLAFKASCIAQGMLHQFTIPYTLKQNGITKWKN